jgi:hypothetical protein
MAVGNGNPVTWRELNLVIEPIKEDLTEIKGDVKILLAAHAGSEAVSSWQRWFFGSAFVIVAGVAAYLCQVAFGL